jgi:uncharacterized phage protein gp47/JayE
MKQIIVDTASAEYLDRWAVIWGLQRKQPNYAEGNVFFTGNDGAEIPAFTKIQTSDNFIFHTMAEAVIKNGTASIKIQADIPTIDANMKGNTPLNLISPIANVKSNCMLDEFGTYNGANIESDDSLKARVLDRIRNAPCAGNKKDYETWCLQIPGITRAWCYPQYPADGSVGLSFVRDNDDNIIPNTKQLEEVKNTISQLMPCTVSLNVFAPKSNVVDFIVKSTDISDETKNTITEQLKYLFFNIGVPGNAIYISDIYESLSQIKNEKITRISLVSPTQDIFLDAKTVGIIGTVQLEAF